MCIINQFKNHWEWAKQYNSGHIAEVKISPRHMTGLVLNSSDAKWFQLLDAHACKAEGMSIYI